ncbi:Rv2175c family DNA-binding protein [Actinokineospora guangxiensis]|uniref:Rv2175c family DNA-binding protein n=1 Tax=Actinokineospora guangxiensis TaxID=1490288 RepID=A0ABW0EJT1_9PSEU
MSSVPAAGDVLDPDVEVLPLPDVAARLDQPITRVRQALRDRHLIALRRDGVLAVPAAFLADAEVVKGLQGTITVLHDAGFSPEETLRWLFTADDSLPGRPIDALRDNRGREVKRRAQALGF